LIAKHRLPCCAFICFFEKRGIDLAQGRDLKSTFELMDAHYRSPQARVIGLDDGGRIGVEYMRQLGLDRSTGIEIVDNVNALNDEGNEPRLSDIDAIFFIADLDIGDDLHRALPVLESANSCNAFRCAIVSLPFSGDQDGYIRSQDELQKLAGYVDSVIAVRPDRVTGCDNHDTFTRRSLSVAIKELQFRAVTGICDFFMDEGLVCASIDDVRAVMAGPGLSVVARGCASGADRAQQVIPTALSHPQLRDIDLANARGVLMNMYGSDTTVGEFNEARNVLQKSVSNDCRLAVQATHAPNLNKGLAVTLVVSGLPTKHFGGIAAPYV
jgi:cell division GTPase FtsZ